MLVYKNSTHICFDVSSLKNPPHVSAQKLYRHKLESMANNSVARYDNFGLICKGLENKATNRPLLTDMRES